MIETWSTLHDIAIVTVTGGIPTVAVLVRSHRRRHRTATTPTPASHSPTQRTAT